MKKLLKEWKKFLKETTLMPLDPRLATAFETTEDEHGNVSYDEQSLEQAIELAQQLGMDYIPHLPTDYKLKMLKHGSSELQSKDLEEIFEALGGQAARLRGVAPLFLQIVTHPNVGLELLETMETIAGLPGALRYAITKAKERSLGAL